MKIGDKVGNLVVQSERFFITNVSGRKLPYRTVLCSCRKNYDVCEWKLTRKDHIRSCADCSGPTISEQKMIHGGSPRNNRTRLYGIWHDMIRRCSNPQREDYPLYGGRGISVCQEWQTDFAAFRDWAMSNGYRADLSIDRQDNEGEYCPGNCRWVTASVQSNNTRRNHHLTAFGETKNLVQWSRDARCVVSYDTLNARLKYGWDSERAITSPSR